MSIVSTGIDGRQASAGRDVLHTPWGDPDIHGVFTTDDELGVPFERPESLPSSMRQYFGDSRGHWEGDTLVVEVTNFPADMINYRGAGGGLHLTERFRRLDAHGVRYEVTVSDPATFARPWTAALHLQQSDVPDVFEYACHEGNYAMRNILSGAREAERGGR